MLGHVRTIRFILRVRARMFSVVYLRPMGSYGAKTGGCARAHGVNVACRIVGVFLWPTGKLSI